MPRIFSSNMVLQQDVLIPVWGWATPGSIIVVSIHDQKIITKTDSYGKWNIYLNPMKTNSHPCEMTISGDGSLSFNNILIGEVWFASGQSNMEFNMMRIRDSKKEITEAQQYPEIRIFKVPNSLSAFPEDDIPGGTWEICDSITIKKFSAAAYFFGRSLHQHLKVPVGLIESAWSGTSAEAWTSYDMLHTMDDFRLEVEKTRSSAKQINAFMNQNSINKSIVDSLIMNSNKGIHAAAHKIKFDDSKWSSTMMPVNFGVIEPNMRGFIWCRKTIIIPREYKGKTLEVQMGNLTQSDQTYFNGELISTKGNSGERGKYIIPGKLVKSGMNIISIKFLKNQKNAGKIGNPCMIVDPDTKETVVDLAGEWKYNEKLETPFPKYYRLTSLPSIIFNSMVHPIIPYAIKGVIWYQGEGNAGEAVQYRELFPKLITDWRIRWKQGYLPFCYVQLANFLKKDSVPTMDPWPELREAQFLTLNYPNTAMASAIDIGEENDIHPTNKQDVGYRLFLTARGVAYNESLVYMGPIYNSYKTEGNKIRIYFTHTGSGLTFKNNKPAGFAIAGEDQKFYWADAIIEGNEIVVSNNKIENPVAVRYGWSNNPDVSLFNIEGLPASPFRTDTWPELTSGKKRELDFDFHW